MEEDLSCKWRAKKKKKAGVAIPLSDKMDFKSAKIKRDKEVPLYNSKRINETRRANYPKFYAPNAGAPRYIKQVLKDLQRDLDSPTIIVGDFNTNTPLTILDRSMRQKVNKEIQDLNADLDQADLIDNYRTLHPKFTEYIFFSAPHCTYFKIDHIIGSKSLISKCKRTKIITVSQTTVQSN